MAFTDKFYAILAAALLLLTLIFLGEQEVKLRHELSVVNKSLDSEIQCRVGSTCASKLADEAARGSALVADAQAKVAAAVAAQKAALDEQAATAIRQAQASAQTAAAAAATWKQKYDAALKSPDCAAWAKQKAICAVR